MSVLTYTDYLAFLRDQIAANHLVRGYHARLAEAAGCQKSYLSRVLNAGADFSADHAAGLARFWGLSQYEAQYFVTLVLLSRAASPALKEMLRDQLRSLREKGSDLSERLNWPTVPTSQNEAVYFSSWHWSAIYVLLSIPQYQSTKALSERLGLSFSVVEEVLSKLQSMGLVKKKGQKLELTEQRIHLPRSSFMTEMNHFNWRQRAISNIQMQDPNAVHYSLVFALSHDDLARLKDLILSSIQQWHGLIGPSPSEEAACLTFDLFRI